MRDYYDGMETWRKSMKDYEKTITSPFAGDLKRIYYALYKKETPNLDLVDDEGNHFLSTTKPHLIPFLDIKAFDLMLHGKAYLVCHFGSIVKGQNENAFQLSTKWCHRAMHRDYVWWNSKLCPRIFQEGDEENMLKVTLCAGYEEKKPEEESEKEITQNQEDYFVIDDEEEQTLVNFPIEDYDNLGFVFGMENEFNQDQSSNGFYF